jgi:secreted PhoX family phosphatase
MVKIDDESVCNPSGNPTFQEIVHRRITRRGFLGGGLATATVFSLSGVDALLRAVPASAQTAPARRRAELGFDGVPVSTADEVVVPPGYTAKVLIAWGDPVSDGPAFIQDASNSAADQALQWGMHNDGLVYFPINGSARGLLVQNNEYADDGLLFPDGVANWTAEKTEKSLNAHGVSIIEITKQGGRGQKPGEWRVVRPSRYARRITGQTPIAIGGTTAPWVSPPGGLISPARKILMAFFKRRRPIALPWNCGMASLPSIRATGIISPIRDSTPMRNPTNRTALVGW